MRKLNKHTRAVIVAVIVALLIIGGVVLWMVLHFHTYSDPSLSSNDPSYSQGTSIPSVSGKGHVAGDDYKNTDTVTNGGSKSGTNSITANDGSSSSSGNNSKNSGDPIYNSSPTARSTPFQLDYDATCYDSVHDKMMQQASATLKAKTAELDNQKNTQVTSLLNDIEAAKPAIRAAAASNGPQFEGDYAYLNQSYDSQAQAREQIPRPSPNAASATVISYASLWSDSSHDFTSRANAIYSNYGTQLQALSTTYAITCG